jgi:hypothetical protein
MYASKQNINIYSLWNNNNNNNNKSTCGSGSSNSLNFKHITQVYPVKCKPVSVEAFMAAMFQL